MDSPITSIKGIGEKTALSLIQKFGTIENLYEKVWGDEYLADSRTLDLHVQRLRRKMGWEENLVAVYKIGYRLEI